MSCDLEETNESARCCEKSSSYTTIKITDCIIQIYYALLSGSKGVNLLDFADCETYKTTQQENPLLTPHAKTKGETWHETPTKQPVCKLI